MKNAHPVPNEEAGAPGQGADIVASGMLPARQNTVIADVLARLIGGARLTGLESVADSSTTRLAVAVHRLGKHWGWYIQREDKAVGCRDGRMTYVSEYRLSDDQRAAALAAGAGEWCREVRAARRVLRAKAAKARADAAKLNAKQAAADPRQGGLFEAQA